ncbi:MAG: hypothetical protein IGR80_09160 [Synechococcales cyanobacterium K44_A2020_017]|nr:hypothetical protein [Synechococcales cyanobacterium K32_A2020_035]MBF2094913.1 hypothetical protein [Synechococcales cyanobacterium K44_A2020_017]
MPEEVIAQILGQMWDVVLEAALSFWKELVFWVQENLLSWIKTDILPLTAESIKLAFTTLSQATKRLYEVIKKAWHEVRRFLVEAFVEFERSPLSPTSWIRRLSSTLIKKSGSGRAVIVRKEVEENIAWESLPHDIRAAWIRNSQKNYKVDIVDARNKELRSMEMHH